MFEKEIKENNQSYEYLFGDDNSLDKTDFEIDKLFEEENNQIKHHLFTGVGKRLQFKDSCIAESITESMVNNNIPILAIHDSFIVQHWNESRLHKLMDYIFRSFKLKSVPKIK